MTGHRLVTCLIVLVQICSISSAQELKDVHNITFVKIPLGKCVVGATPGTNAPPNEFPQHKCRLTRPIWMSQTEITFVQFKTFVQATGYITTNEQKETHGTWRSDAVIEEFNAPVRYITWHDARAYCDWLGKQCGVTCRLPTEHEWEYACRGGARTAYPFGNSKDDLPKYAVVPPEFGVPSVPLPVKSRLPNGFGLYGMLGNVSELCLDSIGTYPARSVEAHVANRSEGNIVCRGGSFGKSLVMATCSYRHGLDPSHTLFYVGFRVVIEADE